MKGGIAASDAEDIFSKVMNNDRPSSRASHASNKSNSRKSMEAFFFDGLNSTSNAKLPVQQVSPKNKDQNVGQEDPVKSPSKSHSTSPAKPPRNVTANKPSEAAKSLKSIEVNKDKVVGPEANQSPTKEATSIDSTQTPTQPLASSTADSQPSPAVSENVEVAYTSEKQLFDAIKQNSELQDQVKALQISIESLRDKYEAQIDILEQSISDSQARCNALESQLGKGNASGDDGLRKQVQDLTRVVGEKEESIKGLLSEGESLAKEILKANNAVKKMRAKELETEKELKDLQRDLESKNAELSAKKERLQVLSESESVLKGNVESFQVQFIKQQKQIVRLEGELATSKEKSAELQRLYEEASKQLLEYETKDNEARLISQAESLSKEVCLNICCFSKESQTFILTHTHRCNNQIDQVTRESGDWAGNVTTTVR